jgi:flagellar assembly protein FliH
MASRIIRAGIEIEAQAVQWTLAGAAPAAPGPAQPLARPGGGPAEGPDDESAARFEQRLREETERARRAGYQEGLGAGKKEALAEMEGLMRQLARSIEAVAGLKPRLRQEAEREVVQLALVIARRVLRREIQVDREAVLGLVKAAFENASSREVTLVRVHPAHAAQTAEYLRGIGAPETIEVQPDAALELGAVVVETGRGTVDASLETQLEEISHGLVDLLPGGGAR